MIRRALILFAALFILAASAYVLMWKFSERSYDAEIGLSYSPEYAEFLGLDPEEAFDAIIADLHPSYIRLAVPWDRVEARQGSFDFSAIDTMIRKAGKSGAKVILTVGQKVPRWPECYIPGWTEPFDYQVRQKALLAYVEETVNRYKDDPAVELWQAENEPFIRFPFGECRYYDISSVEKEVGLIRQLDPSRKIVMTDSGELSSFRRASFLGDILGTTMYRTTRTASGMILRYDWVPPAFYALKACVWGNDRAHFFVAELQAEPWYDDGIPQDEAGFAAEETFSPERFVENVEYAKKAGASRIYLWGSEWWYFMKVKAKDERYWETAQQIFNESND